VWNGLSGRMAEGGRRWFDSFALGRGIPVYSKVTAPHIQLPFAILKIGYELD